MSFGSTCRTRRTTGVRVVAKSVREISANLKHEVALLLDTQGPAIRTGTVEAPYDLKIGDWVSFTVKGQRGRSRSPWM